MSTTKTEREHRWVYPDPAPCEYHLCLACVDMRARYFGEPRDLHYFGWKLLQWNWPGATDSVELAYRRKHGQGNRFISGVFRGEGPTGPF